MKKNVLVFPCGSEIGLELYKSLEYSTHFELIGGSSVDDHGRFMYKNYIGGLPNIDSKDFTENINKIVKENNIDFIFPAHDSVVLKLAEEKDKGRIQCEVITSPVATCKIARSKSKTYHALKDVVAVPHLYNSIHDITDRDFPIFIKPDIGQGSKGAYKVESIEDLKFYVKKDPSVILCEYLPGKEYTVDCFTNYTGDLIFSEGRERKRVSNGISVNSMYTEDERFKDMAIKINSQLSFNGVWFFQVKEDRNKQLVLMEIAPRIAGTMGLARGKGVNLALMSLFNDEKINVSVLGNNYYLEIDRALENKYKHNIEYSHVYIDFDDLIIVGDKVNTRALQYLYQCTNKQIKIHMITRHKEDIYATLTKYRIFNVFEDISVIEANQLKSDFINERESIFIDDSFMERKDVSEKLGIPVFDAHMLESLFD